MKIINIRNGVAAQKLNVDLEGRPVALTFTWNTRYSFFSMGVYDEDDNLLVNGIPVKTGVDLLSPYRFGLGGLIVSAPTLSEEMTIDNVGITTFLVHVPADEL
jgi:hypothetical protein